MDVSFEDFDFGKCYSIDEVEPGLYLGSLFSFESVQTLMDTGITHILSVLSDPMTLPEGLQDVKHMQIKIEDSMYEDLVGHLSKTNEFIDQALGNRQGFEDNADGLLPNKGGVFVHCFMGVSRSATVVAAYLMRKHKLSPAVAVERLRSIRSIVTPNPGFIQQLEIYGNSDYDVVKNPAGYDKWVEQRHKSVKIVR